MMDMMAVNCENSQNVSSIVRHILGGSSQLELFRFEGEGLETVFDATLPNNVSFKLKALSVTSPCSNFPTLPFLIDFLKTQIGSLESLEIGRLQPELFEVVFRMPNLKVFACKGAREENGVEIEVEDIW